jgi:hypothetical protein
MNHAKRAGRLQLQRLAKPDRRPNDHRPGVRRRGLPLQHRGGEFVWLNFPVPVGIEILVAF